MELALIRKHKDLLSLKQDWDAIFAEAAVSHPFLSFEWINTWWQTMLPESMLQSHGLYVLAFYRDGTLQGVVPMFLTRYLPWLFGGLRFLRPLGSDPNLTELKCILARPGEEQEIVRLFSQHLLDHRRSFDSCRLPDIGIDAASPVAMAAPVKVENYILALAATWDDFKAGLKRNIKESIRKCYNAPVRQGVNLDFEAIDNREAILQHLPEYFRLHGLRAEHSDGPVHPNYFLVVQNQIFLRQLVSKLDVVRPRLLVIKHHGKIVAARFAFQMNGTMYLYFSGFEPEYGVYSVTTRLVVECIQLGIEEGLKQINMSTGQDVSKTRWGALPVDYVNELSQSSSVRGRVIADVRRRVEALRALK